MVFSNKLDWIGHIFRDPVIGALNSRGVLKSSDSLLTWNTAHNRLAL